MKENIKGLVFYVNGEKVVEPDPDPSCSLLRYLRNKLHLTGTKLVCGEGGCGACTVMISKYNPTDQKIHHYSVNACLMPVCSAHGLAVTTTEGIGSLKTRLHPVQEQIAKSHGSQCGFCTPGMVMSMCALLRNNPQPTMKEIEKNLEGNLCRCTGYRPILEGYRAFSKDECGMGKDCCKNQKQPVENGVISCIFQDSNYTPIYDPSQEPIFPPELKVKYQLSKIKINPTLTFDRDGIKWYRPVTLSQILDLKHQYPQAKIIVGNTEIGIETAFKNMKYPVFINASDIPELTEIQNTETGIKVGASVTLSKIEDTLQDAIDTEPEEKTKGFVAVLAILKWFAGKQIRNVAAIGGNIMTASPISDLNPVFQACGAVLYVQSKDQKVRMVPMNINFFTGYRKTVVEDNEILVSLVIPFSNQNEYIQSYKQAIRKDDDIAIVNSGMRVVFKDQSDIIEDLYLSYGGMAPTTVMAKQTMEQLKGRKWNEEVVKIACEYLEKDLPLSHDAPGGTVEYRQTLTTSFFFKFYLSVTQQLAQRGIGDLKAIPESDLSAIRNPDYGVCQGIQIFDDSETELGKPLPHSSALQHASGEAVYIDDMPALAGELSLVLVYSKKPHAKILNVDVAEALTVPGVKGYIDHRDIKGTNTYAIAGQDEHLFAIDEVTTEGDVIGGIVAESHSIARKARNMVKVEYEDLPAIISIEDAIKANSYFAKPHTRTCGDVDKAFPSCENTLEDEVYVGAQEHFYLETQSSIVVPKENREMDVYCSAQSPSSTLTDVCAVTGLPRNKVRVIVKRLGGAFGGKETQSSKNAGYAATGAIKYNRPVRIVLDRDDDMVMTGTRHPYLFKFKVGFSNDGKIQCMDVSCYSNCGNTGDLSIAVSESGVSRLTNAYKIPNIQITVHTCKTNIRSNTAFRGFGFPQSLMAMESAIERVCHHLVMDPLKIRQLNFYREGDRTNLNQIIYDCHIQDCWDGCLKQSDYQTRLGQIEQFNRENRWRKRGISMVPLLFGIAFDIKFMNQAGALVNVYTDGTVLLAHGGTEMGQGINVKMIQVASETLGVPCSRIHIIETGTNTVPNTMPTAASTGSDLNGMAVKNACEKINKRLEPFKSERGTTWNDWVMKAFLERVSLSATGFHKVEGLGYNKETDDDVLYKYFSFGAGCSEVEIDCLTGDHTVLRTDIVMDLGKSLNPAVDIGQIEGGFVQGYGLYMLEQYKVSQSGNLLTKGPGTYKIPSVGNIPKVFNVSLLKDKPNPKAVYSSKAIGEPPLVLSISVFFATKAAIMAARKDHGLEGYFRLDSPATPDVIRMACQDQFTKQVCNVFKYCKLYYSLRPH
ncbi:hypothetical protein LOTGIDRAFT_142910 [Lottia gigantea]|uniref:xanthine dehydrogenase n=1 Tax=Lottia gigantea TaxID=225164 RepID=V4A3N3_LOTGI|nr:hypothetical protein LOTGIDRAFT_142910 [Lottia gigantea]ESO98488.1 hypothetical protein LOTGIDRAFT_142910 [Lottia gigantea]